MNTFYRIGKGDEYIEVCADWDYVDYTKFVWWFQQTIAGDKYTNKELAKALREVADSIDDKDE
jgi:hypothetical protein